MAAVLSVVYSERQQDWFCFRAFIIFFPGRGDILAQLCVDGQDLWVAHKGERQDGDGVGRLKMNPDRSP